MTPKNKVPTHGGREREIDRLEKDVEELRHFAGTADADAELERIRQEVAELRREFYDHLGPWQRAQIARHPQRPYTLDFIGLLFTDFMELHGDRGYGDDKAIVAGLAKFHGRPVAVIGHQKGRDTKQRLARNFGQPKPEGYRKALRLMKLAAKYGRPIFTFIDTQGAYPGLDAEERGQAEAIAVNLREMARLQVPIVTVTGEGGSAGPWRSPWATANPGEQFLFRDFAGRLRGDYVARFGQGRDRRGGAQNHGDRFERTWHHRRDRTGAGSRRAYRLRSCGAVA
jgi:acetyl-CoA carboxylase carboxyl transferase alpha subunit